MERNYQEFTFGGYRLEVDVEATRSYYAAHNEPWITCECDGCRNFALAVKELPASVWAFFDALGLDPEKPGELMYYQGTEKTLSGGGWYHLVGRVLEGASRPEEYERFPAGFFELAEGISVGFKNDCDLLPDDFPCPSCQMEFEHCLPWLLEEPNSYIYE
jgi:hypothetical protein